ARDSSIGGSLGSVLRGRDRRIVTIATGSERDVRQVELVGRLERDKRNRQILRRQSRRVEHRYVVVRIAALRVPCEHMSDDVRPAAAPCPNPGIVVGMAGSLRAASRRDDGGALNGPELGS